MPAEIPAPRPPPAARSRKPLPPARRSRTIIPPPDRSQTLPSSLAHVSDDIDPDARSSWSPPPLPEATASPASQPPPVVRSLLPSELDAAMSRWPRLAPLACAAAVAAIAVGMLAGSNAPALQTLAKVGLTTRAAAVVFELVADDASLLPPPAGAAVAPADDASVETAREPEATAQARGTLIASGRNCEFWISGSPYGRAGSVRAKLSAGIHIVGCRSPNGAMMVKSTAVKAGATSYLQF
jgi:hypothetical protein